jgi:hypothetical protein
MAIFERYELRYANPCYRLLAGVASLGEKVPVTVGAIGLVVLGGEPLTGQGPAAIRTTETFPVPRLVLVGYAAGRDHLATLGAPGREFLLVAGSAVNVFVFRDKAFRADRIFAQGAAEAFVVPLFPFVFHFFHSGSEDFAASVTSGRECLVVAVCTEYPVILAAERLVD